MYVCFCRKNETCITFCNMTCPEQTQHTEEKLILGVNTGQKVARDT